MQLKSLVTLLVAVVVLTVAACGGGSSNKDGDLAKAVVQIIAYDSIGEIWSGSGTLISSDGLILTNAHVVEELGVDVEELRVAVTVRTDEPPELAYLAEIVAIDSALDLAVIQVVSNLDGDPVTEDFPFVALGDSDELKIGDELRILGYPGIGGDTITLTGGVVSGFTAERGVEGHAWIKTDATIAGGNSGGLVVNDNGKLVGVPTIFGSSEDLEEIVDCLPISDTNRDGLVNELDTCIAVGGFINGLRPVNLALPLVNAADNGTAYVSEFELAPEPSGGFDVGDTIFGNIVFADGATADDEPTQVLDVIPSGAKQLCGFWDYEGMVDGMTWGNIWFVDGELDEEASFLDDTWVGGEIGINWWVCMGDGESALSDGLYELELFVEDEYMGSNTVFVGGDHPPIELDIENDSSTPICYVFLSPSSAQNWGFDKLGMEEGIDIGDTRTFDLPAGTYDLAVDDCDQEPIMEENEMDLIEDTVYTVTGQ